MSQFARVMFFSRPVTDGPVELPPRPKFENRDSSFDDTGSVMSVSEKREVVAAFIKQVQILAGRMEQNSIDCLSSGWCKGERENYRR